MFICCKYCRSPTSWGNSPWKLLFLRLSLVRNVRFPIDGGRVPDNVMSERIKYMTLPLELLQVIPNQLQWWIESFHKLMMWNGSWTILLLKSSKVCRSVSFPWRVDAAVAESWHVLMHNKRRIPQRNWDTWEVPIFLLRNADSDAISKRTYKWLILLICKELSAQEDKYLTHELEFQHIILLANNDLYIFIMISITLYMLNNYSCSI